MPAGDPLAVSVIVPAHNEVGWLPGSLERILGGMRERSRPFEVVVVENGSTDGTAKLAADLAARIAEVRLTSLDRADYGRALRTGVLSARADLIVIFDVDFVDFAFLAAALERLEDPDGPDLVVGAKRGPGAVDARPWPRRLVTSVFSLVLRFGFRLSVPDTHGIKAMRRATVRPVAEESTFGTDLFDTELVLRAERKGLGVEAIPVSVREERPSRTPIVRRAARTVVGLVRLRLALSPLGRLRPLSR